MCSASSRIIKGFGALGMHLLWWLLELLIIMCFRRERKAPCQSRRCGGEPAEAKPVLIDWLHFGRALSCCYRWRAARLLCQRSRWVVLLIERLFPPTPYSICPACSSCLPVRLYGVARCGWGLRYAALVAVLNGIKETRCIDCGTAFIRWRENSLRLWAGLGLAVRR